MFDEIKGFQVTFMRLFRPNVTINYPEEKRHMSPRFRGLPSLRTDPETVFGTTCASVPSPSTAKT